MDNVLIMKALAVRDGVRLACDIGLAHVILGSDAQEVLKLWRDRSQGQSEIPPILHEIVELSGNSESFQIAFVGNDANEGTHFCAK